MSEDFDFEIKAVNLMSEEEWDLALSDLALKIHEKFNYSYSLIGVGVYRISIDGLDIELSSPRIEEYKDEDLTHFNFTPKFISNLDYKLAFKRRDFTINAIGIEFRLNQQKIEFRIVDPFLGLEDLEKGILREIDDDFFKDPVRFLRLIRFHLRFNFSISKSILENLYKFNLRKLSIYYFKSEFKKSFNIEFFPIFFDFISKNKINLSTEISSMQFLSLKREKIAFGPKGLLEVDLALFYEINKEQAILISTNFGIKYKNFLTMLSLVDFSLALETGHKIITNDDLSMFEFFKKQQLKANPGSRFEQLLNVYNDNTHLLSEVKSMDSRRLVLSRIAELLGREKKT